MRNTKKFMSALAGIAITSQLLTVANIVVYAQSNNSTNTSIEREASTLDQNVITLSGLGYGQPGYQSFKLKFDTKNQKIKATDLKFPGNAMHSYFKDDYIGLELIGEDGEVKDHFTMTGNDKVDVVEEINQEDRFKFEYGDRLVIRHAEADWRVKIDGNVIGKTGNNNYNEKVSKQVLSDYSFELTPGGLKQVPNKTENEITVEGVDCQGGTHAFKISFDNLHKTLQVKSIAGRNCPINPYKTGKNYVTVQVVNEDGEEVKSVTLKGDEPVSKAEQLNGCEFKTGYGLRLTHAEAGSHVKVSGNIDRCPSNFEKGIDKNILENATFRAGKYGLFYKEAEKYPYEITLKGVGCQEGIHEFTIGFNKRDKKIKITNVVGLGSSGHHEFHQYFGNNEYIRLTLIGKNGKEKESVVMRGNDNVSTIVDKFNNLDFKYGDNLKIYHAEGEQRFEVSHGDGSKETKSKGEHLYKITDDDLICIY